ncbi:hypothetical protein [Pontibacter anaerobius]|uniref:Uncharacterized protein n=1 Tax=Pontibacter anaerobius TaxID=2993940 RepID=A0ABT3RG46_9BACT|nr:hypothetical protein [Pontibacter anaerobius]MCX2740230.1 hypothetical protein [Pontibacter anaerobius]
MPGQSPVGPVIGPIGIKDIETALVAKPGEFQTQGFGTETVTSNCPSSFGKVGVKEFPLTW